MFAEYIRQLSDYSGVVVEEHTYGILLGTFKNKIDYVRERDSINLQMKNRGDKDTTFNLKSLTSINRRNGQHHQTNYLVTLKQIANPTKAQEIKIALKESLYVKPLPKKIDKKLTLSDLRRVSQIGRQIVHGSLRNQQRNSAQNNNNNSFNYPHLKKDEKFIIQSNQLSNAYSQNSFIHLRDIKNHNIHCTHNNQHSYSSHSILQKQNKKLEVKVEKREEKKLEEKKLVRDRRNWIKIVTEMKDQLYGHPEKDFKAIEFENRLEDVEDQHKQNVSKSRVYGRKTKHSSKNIQAESMKFRKLDILNSPNILLYDESPILEIRQRRASKGSMHVYVRENVFQTQIVKKNFIPSQAKSTNKKHISAKKIETNINIR